ncbi:suppressor of lurcher protein 1-like [Limulus polyphemus]|uniref:Suppressor of lurcher protein 1-like n=1 Tax=Limulus polyphemus TaxID=6850 RepID=A0ABM1STQ4_LIMPO|nr:suppressor of lurcher protein 1-like [Limulus polyphemus]XP_022247014.1 suppressor of lurcher protein 1-like [Limulus polyphemus]XP_022247018.1 suppressor of lurcher protein 1-like [Limulus polyphemus]XP_022247021.1 suppressor of lurcher protein 1-like [Limulus polyphemus]XP_022247025.1 suppressor of lurcher protein 1-like [Limulus polyphemus]XP_022247030.1 suppressor of lurcher protein 1-like [Limulus polyphemus]XP_022247037.1 suppressor of lurcher protein 1-like [Limulus polyphemus]XP_0
MAVLTLLMCLQFSLFMTVKAVNAGCHCVVYDSTFGKDYGVFTSPNWPIPYEDNINCVLYTFQAEEGEIVEVTFDEFDVQKSSLECHLGDYVRLFLHLEEAAVDHKTRENSILCGKIADIDQTHYSSGQALILEFHTDWRQENNTGFRGTYRFLNKSMFLTDGDPLHGTSCDYQFFRGNNSRSKGYFFSPLYPSTYPRNVMCAYHFMGKYNERVTVNFEKVRLQREDLSCLGSADKISVHDGKDARSPVIGELCNHHDYVEIVSTGPDLYVEFKSQAQFSGQGFKAVFQFYEENFNLELNIPSTEPQNNGLTLPISRESRVHCDMWMTSSLEKNGTFTSPNYPEPYPADVHCVYHFAGRGRERVQVIFTDFDLLQPLHNNVNRDCEGTDVIEIFIKINGKKEKIRKFCGKSLPPQLMSNGPTMTIEFHANKTFPIAKGFQAFYKFVNDFGISVGTQDQQLVCGFLFNSQEQTNGTFYSPNHPGLYPRNTECHYFFIGSKSEKVQVTFTDFDVEGVTPCTADTASDYLEFSNQPSEVTKLPRHCGLKKPKTIESERDFFRVTFKSNSRFDGTGFEAFYQFVNKTDPSSTKRIRDSASNTFSYQSSFLLMTVIFLQVINIKRQFVS